MDDSIRALLAVALYMFTVVGSIGLFLATTSHVLQHEGQASRRDVLEAVGATAVLLFMVAGGFFWFRFIGVGVG